MKNILASKNYLNYDSIKWCVINTKTNEMIEPQKVKINKNLFVVEDESKKFSRAVSKK